MARKPRTPSPSKDDVDRALLPVHRAIRQLVTIASAHPDTELALKAAAWLGDLGSLAAAPVASVIEQVPRETRRRLLVTLLRDVPPALDIDVSLVLMRVAVSDPSEPVRAAAEETAEILRRRSHAKFKRLLAPGAGEPMPDAAAT